ncbi:MAG: ABC transporter ATP-binding protein [Chloroflexia bacterium]
MSEQALLEVRELYALVGPRERPVHAVRGVSFTVRRGARLGVIGESGSGKSMTALSILRLLPPSGVIRGGRVLYDEQDLLRLPESQMQRLRGREISLIFQNAAAALNPLFPVGQQIADVYRHHEGASPREAWERAVAMLDAMGIPDAPRRARAYPHQYSGGMAQRAMIAMALICSPRLLIADEPTTGLDLTIQAQVLDLIQEQVQRSGTSLVLISHDIAVIAEVCDEVVVMYAGEVVESGPLATVLRAPANPYTRALLDCFEPKDGRRLPYIAGRVPQLYEEPVGCAFVNRCPQAREMCREVRPPLVEIAPGHRVACHAV